MLIARTDLGSIRDYLNGKVTTKYEGKIHQVFFKVICDETNLEECIKAAETSNTIAMIEYTGLIVSPVYLSQTATGTQYVGYVMDVGMNVNESELVHLMTSVPYGVTPIFRLPAEYKDMKFVYDMCKKYARLRFCGGNLFRLTGCRVGCVGADILESMGVKSTSLDYIVAGDDICPTVDASALDLDIKATKVSHKGVSGVMPLPTDAKELALKKKSDKPVKHKTSSFTSLLSAGAVDL